MKSFFSGINIKDIVKAILLAIIIPNIAVWIMIYLLEPPITRAFINIDYLLPFILFVIPKKTTKILAIVLFIVIYFIDMLVITIQCLPYDVAAINFFFLLQDITKGPPIYRYLLYLVLCIACIQLLLFIKFSKKTNLKSYILLLIILGTTAPFLPKISNSQTPFFINNVIKGVSASQDALGLKPTKFINVTETWHTALKNNQPINNQVLFILAESWGYSNEAILEEQLKVLKSHSDKFEYFKQGANNSKLMTVIAELSELCNGTTDNIRFLSIVNKTNGFDNCLPNLLGKTGYKSISLHSNVGILYNREHWYPLAGFQEILFGNDVDLPKNSMNDSAIFDLDLIPEVAQAFQNKDQKVFYYWLTYATHQPYSSDEIKNHRFSCEKFDIQTDTDACRSMILNSQFNDGLADLVNMPEMKGVEVIVVGDHSPMFLKYGENSKYFDMSKVSWIHFKIKNK